MSNHALQDFFAQDMSMIDIYLQKLSETVVEQQYFQDRFNQQQDKINQLMQNLEKLSKTVEEQKYFQEKLNHRQDDKVNQLIQHLESVEEKYDTLEKNSIDTAKYLGEEIDTLKKQVSKSETFKGKLVEVGKTATPFAISILVEAISEAIKKR